MSATPIICSHYQVINVLIIYSPEDLAADYKGRTGRGAAGGRVRVPELDSFPLTPFDMVRSETGILWDIRSLQLGDDARVCGHGCSSGCNS
jgi:hypothetical protein